VMTQCRTLVCEDARHSILNAVRLGILGVVRWTLLLLIFGADKSVSNSKQQQHNSESQDEEPNPSQWNVKVRSAMDEANARDCKDPFFSNSLFVLRTILTYLPRRMDISEIANTVLKTLVAKSYPQTAQPAQTNIVPPTPRKRATSNAILPLPPLSSGGSEKSNESHLLDESEPLFASDSLRIGLMRLLKDLYCYHLESDEPKTILLKLSAEDDLTTIFTDILTPRWFMVILEKSHDSVSIATCLRLLGCLMVRENFRRKFCLFDPGLKGLSAALLSDDYAPTTAIILPLLALFFQIPMKFLPLPNDAKVDLLVDIMDKFNGPLRQEPDLSEYTLPLLSIILDCFSANARHKISDQSHPNILISSLLLRAMVSKSFDGMRDLFQYRQAIEVLVLNLLTCSNAWDEYGSHLFLAGEKEDLSTSLQENYIPSGDGGSGGNCDLQFDLESFPEHRKGSLAPQYDSFPPPEIKMISPEGDELEDILFKVLTNTITRYSAPHNIPVFFLAFPRNLNEQHICGYQLLLFNKLRRILKPIFDDLEQDYLQSACNVFTFLVPIAKSRLLHESILYELFQLSVYALDAIATPEAAGMLHEKQPLLLKDLGASARFYATLNLHLLSTSQPLTLSDGTDRRIKIAESIRSNLHLLCPNLPTINFDEISDLSNLKQRKDLDDTKKTTISILDSFGITIFSNISEITPTPATATGVIVGKRAGGNQSIENCFLLATNDKWRTSQFFPLYLLIQAHALLLEDDQNLRTEAMRICAALVIHRKQLIFDLLLSPNRIRRSESQDEEGLESSLFNGFSKLLPTSGAAMYSKMLHSVSVDYEGEGKRFAEFSYWLTDHQNAFDNLFTSLELVASTSMPFLSMTTTMNAIKELITERNKVEIMNNEDSQVISFWNQDFTGYVDSILLSTRRWLVYGFSDIARGSIYWKQVWYSLQSGPIWGIKPTGSSTSLIGDDENYCNLTFTPLKIEEMEAVARIPWKMDLAEGPEKVRRRIEQDYDFEVVRVGDQEIIDADQGELMFSSSESFGEGGGGVDERFPAFSETFDIEELFKKMNKGVYLRDQFESTDEQEQFPELEDELPDCVEGDEDEDEDEDYEEEDDHLGVIQTQTDEDGPSTDDVMASSPSSRFSLDTHRFSVKLFSAARALPDAVRAVVRMDGEETTQFTNSTTNLVTTTPSAPTLSTTPENLSLLNLTQEDSFVLVGSQNLLPTEYVYSLPNIDDEALRQKYILSEFVKGFIGIEEWDVGSLVNISRFDFSTLSFSLLCL
jgi:hypothetical protein